MESSPDNPNPHRYQRLNLSGKYRFTIFIILAISSILGGLIPYYVAFSGDKFLKISYKQPHNSSWIVIVGVRVPLIAGAKNELKNFVIVMISGKVIKDTVRVIFSSWILPFIFSSWRSIDLT